MRKKATNRVDMIDKVYNSWKVLKHSHTNNKIAYYICECLECNTEHTVDGRNIRSGLSKRCVDCGLRSTALTQTGIKKSTKSSKQIAEFYLQKSMRGGARKRKKEWELTASQFVELIYDNCYYCGIAPNTTVNPTRGMSLQKTRELECFITYNGIDRVDSSKGYEVDNVVPCCEQCNRAKLDYSAQEFLSWVERVHNHQKAKNT